MPILLIILLLTTVEQLSIDIYLPSMPAMSEFFQTSDANIQLSMSLYMLGFALSPLISGPLTDQMGRRKILIAGLWVLLLATLVCIFSGNIKILLLGRVAMGFASGFLVVANQSMVRDCYQGKELVKVATYISMAWSAVPIIAPAIGGYIQAYFNWQGNFVAIAIYVLASLFCVHFSLKETMTTQASPIQLNLILAKYWKQLSDRRFLVYVACTAVTFALTTAFITAAPFLFQDSLGLSPIAFGWLAFIVACSYFLGTYVNAILINYYSAHRLIEIGIGLICFFSIIGWLLGMLSYFNIYAITLPVAGVIFSEGLIYPNAAALAFDPVKRNVGIASALYICIQLLACAASSAIVAKLPEHSQVPLMSFLVFASVLLAIIYSRHKD